MDNNATSEDYLREEAQRDLFVSRNERYEVATGCWIDGHWGIHGITRLISIARDYGFTPSDVDEFVLRAYNHGNEEILVEDEIHNTYEWVMCISDDAEDFLNNHVAREGYSFGWESGEFFYMEDEWWDL